MKILKNGKWVDSNIIPWGLGTKWKTDRYIHGPRIRKPEEFKNMFILPIQSAKKRKLKLKNKPMKAQKVTVGTLKTSGKLVVQSYLTPVKNHKRKGRFVRKHKRRIQKFDRSYHNQDADIDRLEREYNNIFNQYRLAEQIGFRYTLVPGYIERVANLNKDSLQSLRKLPEKSDKRETIENIIKGTKLIITKNSDLYDETQKT